MARIEAFALPLCREPFSAISHLAGAVLFAVLAVVLVRRGRGDWLRTVSLSTLAFSTVLLLTISGVYHFYWPGESRQLLARADVTAIFLLIAGSLTPVQTILFRGVARWLPLLMIWTAALAGIIVRLIYFDTLSAEAGIAIFLAMGWGGALTPVLLCDKYGWNFIRLGVMAGLSYTVGAMVLALHRPILIDGLIGPHEIWHVAVLLALGFHWAFVFQFASGELPQERRLQPQSPVRLAPVPLDEGLIVGQEPSTRRGAELKPTAAHFVPAEPVEGEPGA